MVAIPSSAVSTTMTDTARNAVSAVPEFVDETCGILVPVEDATALADAIERLYRDPALFLRLSQAAAQRVRAQSGFDQTIARELALIGRA